MTVAIPEPDDALAEAPYDDNRAKNRRVDTTVGEAAALMLVSGSTFEEIAQILELPSPEVARRITEKALSKKFDEKDKTAAKKLVLARYEALFASAKRRADNPNYSSREAAHGNALRALGEIVRVMGLAEATEVVVRSPVESEIVAELRKIAALAAKDLPDEADVISSYVVDDDYS